MQPPSFLDRLHEAQSAKNTHLCVGLDPDLERLPAELSPHDSPAAAILAFNIAIIEATTPYACAYKINFAFYEALGAEGITVLEETRTAIPSSALTIADAKRGDIGHSARFYATSIFEQLRFDSVTVSPYLGEESIRPFLAYESKATFVLARTSNPGGDHIQRFGSEESPLFVHVAQSTHRWQEATDSQLGLVAGATYPDDLRAITEAAPGLPLLIPGVGAQGGDIAAVVDAVGSNPFIINSSRSILYSQEGQTLQAAAAGARTAAEHTAAEIEAALKNRG